MTSFEFWTYTLSFLTFVATAAAAVAAWYAVVVAKNQLQGLTHELKLNANGLRVNGLLAVVQIETDLTTRKREMDKLAIRVFDLSNTNPKRKKVEQHERVLKEAQEMYNTSIEDYLNCLDRLAHCFLFEYVPSDEWKNEYSNYLRNAIRTYSERFGPASDYTNILKLNEKWQSG